MDRMRAFWHAPRGFVVGLAIGLTIATAGIVSASGLQPKPTITPTKAGQVTNLDILRNEIRNYYGTPGASSGAGATSGWTLALNGSSNYAKEAQLIAKRGRIFLRERTVHPMDAIVFDVDDTTLTTWDYELYSNWDYNPTTNQAFVGLDPADTSGNAFTGNVFPAAPGMVALALKAKSLGYAIFFITGRGDFQHKATIANLVSDTAAGFSDTTTATVPVSGGGTTTVPDVDAGYPMPTAVDIGHDSNKNGGVNFADGLFTKPAVGYYPSYLNQPQFCQQAITDGKSCATVPYKTGTRAYIESLGYHIVANFGDQFSDLLGGYTTRTFKMPNPNYFLP